MRFVNLRQECRGLGKISFSLGVLRMFLEARCSFFFFTRSVSTILINVRNMCSGLGVGNSQTDGFLFRGLVLIRFGLVTLIFVAFDPQSSTQYNNWYG